MTLSDKAATFLKLHTDPELLVLVNVWDAVSAKVVADSPGCRALATASHSIAASHGYPDGEKIPLDLMIDAIGRIVAAVDLPVSADLESGYGDVADTVRRAIGVGAVGANLEDAMRPLGESVAAVSAAVKAGEAEGIRFVLNARTDAFLKAGDRDPEAVLVDAIERGRAFLDAGAACVFVPGRLDAVHGRAPRRRDRRAQGEPDRRTGLCALVRAPATRRRAAVVRSVEPAGRAHGAAGSQRRPPCRRGAARGDSTTELSAIPGVFEVLSRAGRCASSPLRFRTRRAVIEVAVRRRVLGGG